MKYLALLLLLTTFISCTKPETHICVSGHWESYTTGGNYELQRYICDEYRVDTLPKEVTN